MNRCLFKSSGVCLLATLLLAGCVTGSRDPAAPNGSRDDQTRQIEQRAESREDRLKAMPGWRFRGGIGVWNDEQTLSARLDWQQQGAEMQLSVLAPLGVGEIRLEELPDGVATLRRGAAAPARGHSAERLLQQSLGLDAPIPLPEIRQWVLGLRGNAETYRLTDQGSLETLQTRDATGRLWRAEFLSYVDVALTNGQTERLPDLVRASSRDWQVRIRIRDWQLGDVLKPSENTDAPASDAPPRFVIPGG